MAVCQEVVAAEPGVQGRFVRDRLTWHSYLFYGFWSYAWCMFGPAMPFLRSELGFNYSVAAVHFSAMASGLLLAGLIGHKVLKATGSAVSIWTGISALGAGLALLAWGGNVIATIAGGFLVGSGGAFSGQAIVAGLSERFGAERPRAIAELNVSTSVFGTISPFVFSTIIGAGLPWRYAILAGVSLHLLLCLCSRGVGFGKLELADKEAPVAGKLPFAYWVFFAVVFFSVAGEWSIGFWCAEFLEKSVHMSRASACGAFAYFSAAMLAGRWLGSLIISGRRTPPLLVGSTVLCIFGFLLFWLGKNYVVNLSGLALLGLGSANIYPLSLSAAIAASPGLTAQAASRMFLSTGSAILLAPLTLGALADRLGIYNAHAIVGVLLALAALLAIVVAVLPPRRHVAIEPM